MEIINVILIKNNNTEEIKSFGIFDESKKQEVVDAAEKYFKEKALELGAEEDDMEDLIDDGFFSDELPAIGETEFALQIVWTNI